MLKISYLRDLFFLVKSAVKDLMCRAVNLENVLSIFRDLGMTFCSL